jgi:hypothetical protein
MNLLNLSQNQAAVAAAVGFVMPLILSVPIQNHWPQQMKTLFSLAAYGVAAVVTAVAAGTLKGSTWWQSALIIFLTGATSHQTVWKPSKITDAIEDATSTQVPGASVPASDAGGPAPAPPPLVTTDTVNGSPGSGAPVAVPAVSPVEVLPPAPPAVPAISVGNGVTNTPSPVAMPLLEPDDVPGVDDVEGEADTDTAYGELLVGT